MTESAEQEPVVNQCPDCSQSIDVSAFTPFSKIICPHCGSSVRVRTVMGKYQIIGILGEGGMSQVFRAVDVHLQREVALKILHRSLSQDSALTAMFEREAKLTASILHPNVVKVYTVGEDQGYFFIAMELVDATSMEEMIAKSGAITEATVLQVAHDVTNGLKAAHEEELIHRDIKPGNMLVTADGTAKLVDFGLAVQQGGEDESEDLWATPFYVPPEKLEGEIDTYLGDIYSLGATLYHALAGKPPFEANTSSLEELKIIKQSEIDLKSEAPGLSRQTLKLIETMMAYQGSDRPQSYDEILSQIEEIEKKQFGIRRRRRGQKNNTKVSWLILGTFSALTAVVAGIYIKLQNDRPSPLPGDLGIGSGERVISAGDNDNTEKFLAGRQLISEGRFEKAEQVFDELSGETSPSPSTRMWTLYFQGLTKLFLGKEEESRSCFGMIEAFAPKEEADPVTLLMRRVAVLLSEPLPVIEADNEFEADSIELAGLLAAGLKNWQAGQFESGMRMLDAFATGIPPEGYEWLGGVQGKVAAFRDDFHALQGAPNPSRKSGKDLSVQKEKLESIFAGLKTSGALPELIRSRINRSDKIVSLIAEEKAAVRNTPTQPVVKVKPEPVPPRPVGTKLSAEEKSERAQLLELIASFSGYSETLLFSAAVAKLDAADLVTPAGTQWREDLKYGYAKADEFVSSLSRELNKGTYEGIIRRREGVPLDAKITRADSSIFVVDLGFGPNEVEVDSFAPDWMLEAALAVFPEPSAESFRDFESTVFFAIATGQPEAADQVAATLPGIDSDFDGRWKRLQALRKPAD
ncbi:MAG: serine/threonine-protein kinase [Verrucomicrobiales bacterium]|nr:serine/threonine-protein kinase [Verrucomicrobiales bacterium]